MKKFLLVAMGLILALGIKAQLVDEPLLIYFPFDMESAPAYNPQGFTADTFEVGYTPDGKFHGAGVFDTSFVVMNHFDTISCSKYPYTWSMWIKTEVSLSGTIAAITQFSGHVAAPDTSGNLTGDDSDANDVCGGPSWMWIGWLENSISFEAPCAGFDDFAADPDNPTDAEILTDGEWHHIVLVNHLDAQENYIDGQKVSEGALTMPAADVPLVLKIGYSNSSWPEVAFWNGLIDDFRMYAAALTPEEVTELYLLEPEEIVSGINTPFAESFSVYPNPASHSIVLKGKHVSDVEILNSNGQSVMKISKAVNGGSIDVSGLEKGFYFIKSGNFTQKLIIN
jgi:hypothetical protein